MPGFVDVSNMSYEDVRRLGHEDDSPVYRNPYAYRKPAMKKPSFSYDADKVWGAAVVAFRANNGYIKALAPGVSAHKTNRQIVEEILKDDALLLDSDMEEGRKIRQYFQALTFKVIEGKQLSPFLKQAMEFADKEQITDNLSVGIIASLPSTYNKMTERDSIDNRIKWARGGFIGVVGDKTTQTIEVVKQNWSQQWNTYYITGINDKDQVLFFAYKNNIEIGSRITIEGAVKAHRDSSTQLNRVKVI